MQKLTAQFLILFMLFANAAWALDSEFMVADHESTSSHILDKLQIDVELDDERHNNSEDSDHCCHGAAHLIGLTSVKLMRTEKVKEVAELQIVTRLISFKQLPPTPPPIA